MPQGREYKHERIARLLRERYAAVPAGTELPSEPDLMDEYEAARGTVRQALATLKAEGLVTSQSGSPWTVREMRRWRWDMTGWEKAHRPGADAWKATVLEQGAETAESAVRVEHITAPAEVAAALNISEGTPIVTRSRAHFINGETEQLSQSFYPPWVTEGFPPFTQPGDVEVPGGLLAASGHRQVRFHDVHTARAATAEESARLRMSAGALVQLITRTGYDGEGRPVRHIVFRMVADRAEVTYDLTAE